MGPVSYTHLDVYKRQIIGIAVLLAYTRLNTEQSRFVGHIRTSADSLLRVLSLIHI